MAEKQSEAKRGVAAWEPLVIGIACVLPTLVTLAYFVAAAGSASSVQQAVYSVAKVVQFALPVVWAGLVLREKLAWPRWNARGLGLGILFGLAVAGATFGLYTALSGTELLESALEPIRAKVAGMGLASPLAFVLLGVFYSLFHSLLEEYYWRWFVFGRLQKYLSVRGAIALSAVAFAAHHVVVLWIYFSHAPAVALLLASAVAVGGAVWAWLYQRTGSMYAIWASHLLVDAAIFAVGYHVAIPLFRAAGS